MTAQEVEYGEYRATDRILLLGDLPPGRLAEFSRHVEAAGFSELWLAEDYFFLSGFASAAIALQATTRIKVGIGAVANRVRHPAVTAMEATTLAGAFPGRFDSLGVGHGLPFWMRQMKLYPKSVLTSLREAVIGIRRLARGETLTESGEYYSYDQVKLVHPAPDLKILTAVVQARSMELTAQIADGSHSVGTGRSRLCAFRGQTARRALACGRAAAWLPDRHLCARLRRARSCDGAAKRAFPPRFICMPWARRR